MNQNNTNGGASVQLRDTLVDLTTITIPTLTENYLLTLPEISISRNLLNKIIQAVDMDGHSNIYTSSIKTSTFNGNGLITIFPHQYFILAVKIRPYADGCFLHCQKLDEILKTGKDKRQVLDSFQKASSYDGLSANDFRLMQLFTTDLVDCGGEYRNKSKKFRNGSDKVRSTSDIFNSMILKIAHLTNASSSFFGDLVYTLEENPTLYNELESEITKNYQISDVSLGETPKHIQIIYYGIPGSGKSNTINKMLKFVPPDCVARVVFHPDYTNADFVGQILPVINKTDDETRYSYDFAPGPFSIILKRAIHNSSHNYYLVIEEINRGNSAAIFGDLFQLLDRLGSIDKIEEKVFLSDGRAVINQYGNGWSEYKIDNYNVSNYILGGEKEIKYDNSITINTDTGIRLPPNLSILATMNTSDQNVFVLDTAFQRRWEMKYIQDALNENDSQYKMMIADTGIEWGKFREVINKEIIKEGSSLGLSTEDKRLGAWFITDKDKESNKTITEALFSEKVLKYLWDDVFKLHRNKIFDETITSFDQLIDGFAIKQSGPNRMNVLLETIRSDLGILDQGNTDAS